jgi:hypothetical protein
MCVPVFLQYDNCGGIQTGMTRINGIDKVIVFEKRL